MQFVKSKLLLAIFFAVCLASCSSEQGKSPAQAILDATTALDGGEPATAIIILKNAIQRNPRDPFLRAELASVFLAIGDGISAEIEAEKARDYGYDNSKSVLLIARTLLRQQKVDDALALLLSLDSANAVASEQERQLLLAKVYLEKQQLVEAERALAESDEQLPEARETSAKLIVMKGNADAAVTLLTELLDQRPTYASAWSLLGDIHRFRGEPASAIEAYGKAIEYGLDSQQDRWNRALLNLRSADHAALLVDLEAIRGQDKAGARAAFLEGAMEVQKGEYASAQPLLQTAVEKAPAYLPAKYFLALTHFRLKEHQSAEQFLAGYVAARPNHVAAREVRALNLWQLGQQELAVEEAQAILELDGNNAMALEMMSIDALGRGHGQEALAALERLAATGAEGDVLDLRLGLGYLMAGQQDKGTAALEKASESGGDAALRADTALVFQWLKAKNYDRALQIVDGLQQKLPGKVLPYSLRGTVLAEKGDLVGAQEAFEKAWSMAPGDAPTGRSLARVALKSGDMAQAEKYLRDVLVKHPEDTATRIELAQLLLAQKDSAGFLVELEMATRQSPSDPRPWLLLLRFDLASNNIDKALERLEQMPAEQRNGTAVAETAGFVYLRAGRASEAEKIFARLVEQMADRPQFRLWLAESQAAQDKIGEARDTLELAAKDLPDDLNVWIALSNLEIAEGNLNKAEGLVERVSARDSNGLATASLTAKIAFARGDFVRAAEAMEKVVATKPTREDVYRLVNATSASGQEEKAIALGEQWVERDAGNIPLRLLLAELYAKTGDHRGQVGQYRAVLAVQPENVVANNNLAWIMADTDPAAALGFADAAYRQAPDDTDVADTYGWVLHLNGSSEKALQILEKAYSNGSGSNSAKEHLNIVRQALSLTATNTDDRR